MTLAMGRSADRSWASAAGTTAALFVFGLAVAALPFLKGQPAVRALVAENGPLELLTFLAFFVAFVWAFAVAARLLRHPRRAIAAAIMVAYGLGCFLVAGEEVAWGQWFHPYDTPGAMQRINQQGEMTLHNIDGLQGKSEAFRLAFGLGGLAGMALGRLKAFAAVAPPTWLAAWFLLIALFGAGELATDFVVLPVEAIHDGLRSKIFSEFQELVIAGVALTYVAAIARRRRRDGAVQTG